jgi:hypothetical protein
MQMFISVLHFVFAVDSAEGGGGAKSYCSPVFIQVAKLQVHQGLVK